MDGHLISMVSLRDDTVESTDYFNLHHKFHYLTRKQLVDLKWLLEQLYEVVIDEGEKRIIRQKFYDRARDRDDLLAVMNDSAEQPEWVKGLLDIQETSKDIMNMMREDEWEVVR